MGVSPCEASPAAIEIMFCSLTPVLIKRSLMADRTFSKAIKPKSPVRKMTFLFSVAIFSIVLENSLRMSFLDNLCFPFGFFILFVGHGKVVPFKFVFHERNSVAKFRFGDDTFWFFLLL